HVAVEVLDRGATGVVELAGGHGDRHVVQARRKRRFAHRFPLSSLRSGALAPRFVARRDTRHATTSLIASRSRRFAPGRSTPASLLAGTPGTRPLRSSLVLLRTDRSDHHLAGRFT